MIAVGIDVSKSKSTVAILNGDGSIRAKPFDVHHVADELQALVDYIKRTSEPPTILMEPTSHYHYPLLKAFTEAELPVCLINPYQMKKYCLASRLFSVRFIIRITSPSWFIRLAFTAYP